MFPPNKIPFDNSFTTFPDFRAPSVNLSPKAPPVPAFGDKAVLLDNFNRPNESPANDNWTWTVNQCNVVNNQLKGNGTGNNLGYWNTPPTSPNYEMTATMLAGGVANGPFGSFWLRYDGVASGYQVGFQVVSGEMDTIGIVRFDGGVGNSLAQFPVAKFGVSQRIGAKIVGDTISAYLDTGNGWEFIGQAIDDTYTEAGVFGVRIQGNVTIALDDFAVGMLP